MTRRFRATLLGLVALLLALTACQSGGPGPVPEPVREPSAAETPLPEVDTSGLWLPMSIEEMQVVDPGWDTMPQQLDGVFLGATERYGVLEFTAVDAHGEVLWVAQRPTSHPDFSLTSDADGDPIAVLTDAPASGETSVDVSATAYELTTGTQIWGPVEVPAPHQGPGLVFGAPVRGSGDELPRLALDPATGRTVVTQAGAADPQIIGEYGGTLLLKDDEALFARDAADDRELWRTPLDEHGWSTAAITASMESSGSATDQGFALIDTPNNTGALIDLSDGTVVSDAAQDTAVDPTTGTRVILDDDGGLRATDPAGQELWSLTVAPGTTIAALGGVFLYLRDGDAVRVHNVMTGAVAQAYAPDGAGQIVVPAKIAATGAAALPGGDRYLLATTEPGPGQIAPGAPTDEPSVQPSP